MYKWNFDECRHEVDMASFHIEILDDPEMIVLGIDVMNKSNRDNYKISSIDLWREAFRVRAVLSQRYYERKERARKKKAFSVYYKKTGGAISKVRNALKSGKLIKPKRCQACGGKWKIEGHHEDYNKPLEVIWLCNKCHIYLHRGWMSLLPHPMYQPICA
jgi:hypothetical protein